MQIREKKVFYIVYNALKRYTPALVNPSPLLPVKTVSGFF